MHSLDSSGVALVGRVDDILKGYGGRVLKLGFSAIIWLMESLILSPKCLFSRSLSL